MLQIIAYIAISILVVLICAYIYVETQRLKAIEEKKKAMVSYIAAVKSSFRVSIKQFIEEEILTMRQYESIYRIVNNFFVFQPITDANIKLCQYLCNSVINAMPNASPESTNYVLLQEQINLFISLLPATSSGYSASFYREELPLLIKKLLASKEYIYKVENGINDESEISDENEISDEKILESA